MKVYTFVFIYVDEGLYANTIWYLIATRGVATCTLNCIPKIAGAGGGGATPFKKSFSRMTLVPLAYIWKIIKHILNLIYSIIL